VNWLRRLWPASRREPRHVRLHILHEGTDSKDMTLEGFQTSESRDWVVLERAVILYGDGRRVRVAAAVDVPRARILLREHLVAVALPELPELVGA
jgi:hypothetical protein